MFGSGQGPSLSKKGWKVSGRAKDWTQSIRCLWLGNSDGSGPKNFDPGRVSHSWFGFEFGKCPLKMSIFFPSGQKKSLRVGSKSTQVKGGSASYLLRVKSKLRSGQGPSLLGNPWIIIFFQSISPCFLFFWPQNIFCFYTDSKISYVSSSFLLENKNSRFYKRTLRMLVITWTTCFVLHFWYILSDWNILYLSLHVFSLFLNQLHGFLLFWLYFQLFFSFLYI